MAEEAAESDPVILDQPQKHGFLPTIDYVLVYDAYDGSENKRNLRNLFCKMIHMAGLQLEEERIGSVVFQKIFCPFERLAEEAELVKLERNLKGCEVVSTEERGLLGMLFRKLTTDNEADFISAPFCKDKLHLFEGSEDKISFFRDAERSLLVNHMLINLDLHELPGFKEEHGKKFSKNRIGLYHLIINSVYKDAFILHAQSKDDPFYQKFRKRQPKQYETFLDKLKRYSDPRRELNSTWTSFWKFQPLWKIRNYFGEKIAFYFAWQGTLISLLWVPTIMGIAVFIYGLCLSIKNNHEDKCACVNMTGTSGANYTVDWFIDTNYVKSFKQCESIIELLTGNIVEVVQEAFSNNWTPYFSFFVCLWGSAFIEMWKRRNSKLAYEWDVNNYEDAEPDRPEFYGTEQRPDAITKEAIWVYPERRRQFQFFFSTVVVAGMMCFVFLSIAGVITFRMYIRVHFGCPLDNNDCNQKPADSPAACIILGTFTPAVLNSVSVLIWTQVYSGIAVQLTNWENHQTQSDYNNALIVKLFAFNFVNSYAILFYIAFFRPQTHNVQEEGLFGLGSRFRDICSPEKCMSLLSLQVLLLMITKPLMKFFMDVVLPRIKKAICIRWKRGRASLSLGLNQNVKLAPTELVTDVRSWTATANRNYIYKEWKKPQVGDFSLDEFNEKVLLFGYLVMFSAALPLAPLIALAVNLIDMRVDARRLLWLNRRPIPYIASDIGMWSMILRFLNFCGIITNAYLVGTATPQSIGLKAKEKLIVMILFEHIVLVLEHVIDILVPDVPSEIKENSRRERYEVYKILEGEIPLKMETRSKSKLEKKRKLPSCNSLPEEDLVQSKTDSVAAAMFKNTAALAKNVVSKSIECPTDSRQRVLQRRASTTYINMIKDTPLGHMSEVDCSLH